MATEREGGGAEAPGPKGASQGAQEHHGAIRDPDEWKTGDEPITAAQRSYLHTLALEAGEPVDDAELTKAGAAKKIEELQQKTGRGRARQ